MVKLLGLVLTLTALAGCARGGRYTEGRFVSRDLVYRADGLPDAWDIGAHPGADVSFVRRDLGATIYVDNSCTRYRDASLHTLANHLFFGFEDVEVLQQDILQLDGREALRRVAEARLDGVLVRLGITVLKKNNCIFDLVLISEHGSFDAAFADYLELLESFQVERCP